MMDRKIDYKQLGIDFDYLKGLPLGGGGREWPAPWAVAAKILFVNGFSARDIEDILQGPKRITIYSWIDKYKWQEERDKYMQELAEKALVASQETQVEVNQRHLKSLIAMQNAAILPILNRQVQPKSLEGTMTAAISAMRMERDILGLAGGTPETTILQDNRVQTVLTSLDGIPTDKLEEFFALQQKKMELDGEIANLTTENKTDDHFAGDEEHDSIIEATVAE